MLVDLLLHPSLFDQTVAAAAAICVAFLIALLPLLKTFRDRVNGLLFHSGEGRFRLFLFTAAAGIFSAASLLLFDGLPRLTDGIAAVFQAKIFLRGAVTLPLHPEDGFFFLPGVLGSKAGVERWSSMYPPGWPGLLMPGVAMGISWIVNPVLGGLLAVAVSILGRDLYSERIGRTAGLLVMASPFVMVISSTHLSHTATALFCTLALISAIRMLDGGGMKWGAAAGLSWGLAFLCRPLTALVLGVVFVALTLPRWRSRGLPWRAAAAAVLLCLSAGIKLAAYQNTITGDPLTPGHKLGLGRFGKLGFGVIDERNKHTPLDGIEDTILRVRALSTRLLGWPVAAFLLVLAPFILSRAKWEDWWLLAAALSLLLVFATFYYYERYFPARYTFAAVPMLLVLAARGWARVADLLRRLPRGGEAFPFALAAASISFMIFVSSPAYLRSFGPSHGDMESVLPRVVEAYEIKNAIVFMDSVGTCRAGDLKHQDYYGAGFHRNSLDLDGDIIYARNSRRQNRRLMELHPERSYYIYRFLRCDDMAMLFRLLPEDDTFSLELLPPLIPEMTTAVSG